MATFFFCGIGGIGMSAIALYLKKTGHIVCGSDRSFDQHINTDMQHRLEKAGIILFPQDGSGVNEHIDVVVVSTAVESRIPDIQKAQELNRPIRRRAEILADILHTHVGIAVGGTSGKTTVTAMVNHILCFAEQDPLMINGGLSLNTYGTDDISNLHLGQGKLCVIEADESDGSINLYTPAISVVTNISLDHKPIHEIRPLFQDFLNRTTQGIVTNADDPETQTLQITHPHHIRFSLNDPTVELFADDICIFQKDMTFKVNGQKARLPIIGRHNIENALAALGACQLAGVSLETGIMALASFKGTARRMQTLGTEKNITVIDDYAHNPAKIHATLDALSTLPGRLICVFQPHGFAPTRLMKEELLHMLKQTLNQNIIWIMPDIFYAGGTVAQDISSQDIISPLQEAGKQAFYVPRTEIPTYLKQIAQAGDRIIIMGGRDNTLTELGYSVLTTLKEN